MKYIVYCLSLEVKSSSSIQIISIDEDEKNSKTIQNSHAFNLLCELNKKESLYKLEVKSDIIHIIQINININSGWISNKITEDKIPIYEIGIITYKDPTIKSLEYISEKNINDSYIPVISNPKQTKIKNDNKNLKHTIGLSSVLNELKNRHKLLNNDD